jgi:hypothetical protein
MEVEMRTTEIITRLSTGMLLGSSIGMLGCLFAVGMFGNPHCISPSVAKTFVLFSVLFGLSGLVLIAIGLVDLKRGDKG